MLTAELHHPCNKLKFILIAPALFASACLCAWKGQHGTSTLPQMTASIFVQACCTEAGMFALRERRVHVTQVGWDAYFP